MYSCCLFCLFFAYFVELLRWFWSFPKVFLRWVRQEGNYCSFMLERIHVGIVPFEERNAPKESSPKGLKLFVSLYLAAYKKFQTKATQPSSDCRTILLHDWSHTWEPYSHFKAAFFWKLGSLPGFFPEVWKLKKLRPFWPLARRHGSGLGNLVDMVISWSSSMVDASWLMKRVLVIFGQFGSIPDCLPCCFRYSGFNA